MKLRERLTDESYSDSAKGGVCGCPEMYDLPENPDCPLNHGENPTDESCTKCWDREIPDKFDEAIKKWEDMSK